MHVASSRDTCRLKTWGLAYLRMNFHPRIMLIYALLSLKCRKSYLRAIKTSICPSFRPSNARIFVKKAPVFRSSFSKYGPVWRIGHTAERPEMIYMVTGQEWFSTIFTNNSNRPRRSWREEGGRRTSTTGLWLWRRGAHWLGNQKWVMLKQMF